jgi:DNA-3-methyladenine glycosylase
MTKLPLSFYQQDDVLEVSRKLLGKYLFTHFDNVLTGGMIIETEAYRAPEDRASHAYGMRRTKRNEVMYQAGGVCYVYLCYGIHALFNVITNQEGIPHAILIRAIKPLVGIETMLKRRHKQKIDCNLTGGPGTLTDFLARRYGLRIREFKFKRKKLNPLLALELIMLAKMLYSLGAFGLKILVVNQNHEKIFYYRLSHFTPLGIDNCHCGFYF